MPPEAWWDGSTVDRGNGLNLDLQAALANNDSYHYLNDVGDLLVTGADEHQCQRPAVRLQFRRIVPVAQRFARVLSIVAPCNEAPAAARSPVNLLSGRHQDQDRDLRLFLGGRRRRAGVRCTISISLRRLRGPAGHHHPCGLACHGRSALSRRWPTSWWAAPCRFLERVAAPAPVVTPFTRLAPAAVRQVSEHTHGDGKTRCQFLFPPWCHRLPSRSCLRRRNVPRRNPAHHRRRLEIPLTGRPRRRKAPPAHHLRWR